MRTLTRNTNLEGLFGGLVAGVSPGLLRPRRAATDDAGSRSPLQQLLGAVRAGIGRIVHFPVANASPDSALPYFRGKGQAEEILQEMGKDMGIPYAIIPAGAQLPRVAAIATGRMGGVNANLIMIAQ